MRTGAAIGQAVGLAAALCTRRACTPRKLGEAHLQELQQELLRRDATILYRASDDETDLARRATVSATSELRFNDQEPGQRLPLIAPAAVVLWDWPPTLHGLELYLRNEADAPQELTITVARARREPKWKTTDDYHDHGRNDLRDEAFQPLHTAAALVPADFEGWLDVDLGGVDIGEKDAASDDDRLLISVSQNPNIGWAVAQRSCEIAEMVEHSHHSPRWRSVGAMATLRLDSAPALGEATNAVNGFHRRFSRGPTNMWMSDPADGLPQELVLAWDQQQTFGRVCVTFDNIPRLTHDNPWHCGKRVLGMCAKDYDISVQQGGEWHEIVSVQDNYHRWRVHDFAAVTTNRLRLRVLAAHEEGFGARVYEVRVYAGPTPGGGGTGGI